MKLISIVTLSVALAACTTSSGVSPQMASAQKLYNQKMDECEARKHKHAVDKARCINGAEQVLLPVAGGDVDLLRHQMAKRIEIAQRFDAGKISRAQANSELTSLYSRVASEAQQRQSQRMQAAAQFITAQNQADAMQSIANSQSRMATAMENANDAHLPRWQRKNPNGLPYQ